jgi:hypothetical protein
MALSKKDQAKIKYLNSSEGKILLASLRKHNIPVEQVSDTVLPDNFVFDGWKVVDGEFCKTSGEYKAAIAKSDTDMSGWHG